MPAVELAVGAPVMWPIVVAMQPVSVVVALPVNAHAMSAVVAVLSLRLAAVRPLEPAPRPEPGPGSKFVVVSVAVPVVAVVVVAAADVVVSFVAAFAAGLLDVVARTVAETDSVVVSPAANSVAVFAVNFAVTDSALAAAIGDFAEHRSIGYCSARFQDLTDFVASIMFITNEHTISALIT